MIELTRQQQDELKSGGEFPPRVRDPRTNATYVLLHAEMFERVRPILEEEDEIPAIEEMYPLVDQALTAGEEDDAAKESA